MKATVINIPENQEECDKLHCDECDLCFIDNCVEFYENVIKLGRFHPRE